MYFPILTGVQYGRFNSRKIGDILLKNVFFVTELPSWMAVAWFLLSLFNVNSLLFSL